MDDDLIKRDFDLSANNFLALPSRAEYFCAALTQEMLMQALLFAREQGVAIKIIASGSNVVLPEKISGLVISPGMQGIVKRGDRLQVSAGVLWDDLVKESIERFGLAGLENLSGIPGTVGAAPIQNIGAYGVELSSLLVSLQIIDIQSGKCTELPAEACQFSYRDSVFKQSLKDKCIITQVTLRLSTEANINIDYPALNAYFAALEKEPTPQLVADAVCEIRREKLPYPSELANVGSFFKNPVIERSTLVHVQAVGGDVEVPFYPQADESVKVPAAWLIDQCKFRGVRRGGVGVHDRQALVLVNYSNEINNDSAKEVLALAKEIQAAVKVRFGIELEVEPRIYGAF